MTDYSHVTGHRGQPELTIDEYEIGLDQEIEKVFRGHPELVDHRGEHPWLRGCLGDPFTRVWLIAENPSLSMVRTVTEGTFEDQWTASPRDRIFRERLQRHGFKTGGAILPGGWRCYITDVIKSADIAKAWRDKPTVDQDRVAESWAPVLSYELEHGQPELLVILGKPAQKQLERLAALKLIPPLPEDVRCIYHYSYLGQRPESGKLQSGQPRRGPGDPGRIAEWDEHFATFAAEYPPGRA